MEKEGGRGAKGCEGEVRKHGAERPQNLEAYCVVEKEGGGGVKVK